MTDDEIRLGGNCGPILNDFKTGGHWCPDGFWYAAYWQLIDGVGGHWISPHWAPNGTYFRIDAETERRADTFLYRKNADTKAMERVSDTPYYIEANTGPL